MWDAGRGQPGSGPQEVATQSADMNADDSTADGAEMDSGFGAYDDFDDGDAGIPASRCIGQ